MDIKKSPIIRRKKELLHFTKIRVFWFNLRKIRKLFKIPNIFSQY